MPFNPNCLLPRPQKVGEIKGEIVIGHLAGAAVSLTCDAQENPLLQSAAQVVRNVLSEKAACPALKAPDGASYRISLTVAPSDPHFSGIGKAEAYFAEIGEKEAKLCGADPAGAFYAAATFARLLFVEGDEVRLPLVSVLDYPDFPLRGNYIECRYGTEFLTKEDWFRIIDYYASMKCNVMTVGVYGCWSQQYDDEVSEYLYLPVKAYPELKTPKKIRYYSPAKRGYVMQSDVLPTMFREDFFGDLVAYGKEKNVTVRPLFNSLGHNRLLPETFPEISAVTAEGKPSLFGFCTRNEKTYEVLFGIYDEIIDRYLTPNGVDSIHVGLDEVGAPYVCHCAKCEGTPQQELMMEHLIRICKHLKEKGMRKVYIFHDMFYHIFNMVNEEMRDRLIREDVYDMLVMDWWTYEDPAHLFWDKPDGVNSLLHSIIKPFTGYYHWTIPTDSNDNIRACAKLAKERGFEGVEAYSAFEDCYDKNFYCLAEAGWNLTAAEDKDGFDARYAALRFPGEEKEAERALFHMQELMRDVTGKSYMNSACYDYEYYFYCYRRAGKRQNFPGDAFRRMREREAESIADLTRLREHADLALRFFTDESRPADFYRRVWKLTAWHYRVLADEYLTLNRLDHAYNAGEITVQAVTEELERLLAEREALMEFAEEVRIPATVYTYLRNMTLFRQVLLDLLAYFRRSIAAGQTPKLDVTDLSYTASKLFHSME